MFSYCEADELKKQYVTSLYNIFDRTNITKIVSKTYKIDVEKVYPNISYKVHFTLYLLV